MSTTLPKEAAVTKANLDITTVGPKHGGPYLGDMALRIATVASLTKAVLTGKGAQGVPIPWTVNASSGLRAEGCALQGKRRHSRRGQAVPRAPGGAPGEHLESSSIGRSRQRGRKLPANPEGGPGSPDSLGRQRLRGHGCRADGQSKGQAQIIDNCSKAVFKALPRPRCIQQGP